MGMEEKEARAEDDVERIPTDLAPQLVFLTFKSPSLNYQANVLSFVN